jgi:hypothetical protein
MKARQLNSPRGYRTKYDDNLPAKDVQRQELGI